MNDGGPAFPKTYGDSTSGMSLLDWFASQSRVEEFVLQQLYQKGAWELLDGPNFCPATKWEAMSLPDRFHCAVAYHKSRAADAMLAEREKKV